MKQFNLQEYLANPSRKVVTRCGRSVRILCTDARRQYPVIALVEEGDGVDSIESYLSDGTYLKDETNNYDLFFDTEKREGWINVYKPDKDCARTDSVIFKSKEEAIRCIGRDDYVGTIHIEW